MLGGLGWQELVIVLVIVIIIFGAGRLPEIGGAVGKSIKEFRNQSADEDSPEGIAPTTTANSGTTVNQATVNDAPKAPREVRADEI